jgi:hypothetical protein
MRVGVREREDDFLEEAWQLCFPLMIKWREINEKEKFKL